MKTMISNLPRDLIEDIISRVPLESMRAVRLTCKRWNDLSKSQSFLKMHIGKAVSATREGESQMIVMMNYNLYLMSLVFNEDPFIEPKGKLICLDKQVRISQVLDCEGLLLCILKDDITKVVVWNPYCGETKWIESSFSHHGRNRPFIGRCKYAIGYVNNKNNSSCRSYKILRSFNDYFWPAGHCPKPEDQFSLYDIYDFDSGLWTTLEVSPHWRICFDQGVSLKGNTYWCASKKNSEDDGCNDHIICFSFTTERFGPLLRLPFSATINYNVTLSCVREEKLAVLVKNNREISSETYIWITTKIETEEILWSKFLTVDMEPKEFLL